MKIKFNQLGVIVETITNDESLRQGNVGNHLEVTFEGKNNINYTAYIGYTRSDGSSITEIALTPNGSSNNKFNYVFDDPWFFALYGTTTCSIKLVSASGTIAVSGQFTFNIEQTDFSEDDPQITVDQLASFQALIASKLNIRNGLVSVANLLDIDVTDFQEGQYFFVEQAKRFYKLSEGQLEEILDFHKLDYLGIIVLENLTTPLDEYKLEELNKPVTFLYYANNYYIKFNNYYNYQGNNYIAFGKESDLEVLIVGDIAKFHSNLLLVNSSTGEITRVYKDLGTFYTQTGSNSTFVKILGDQTIYGNKVFNKSPQTNDSIDIGTKVTTKNYVDQQDSVLQDQIDTLDRSLDNYVPLTQKGTANGVATLDNNAKIPLNQLPDSILGQVKWIGNIYIVSSTSADNYNMRECGVVQLTDYALDTLGLIGQTEITINGLTVTGTNLVTYLDLFNAIIEKYDDARLVSMFFIVSSRINHNGPVWTGYNVLTDVALSGFTSPSVQAYFTNVSTGDWIMILSISNLGSITYAKVDNSDAVISVNSKTGSVTLYGTDIKLSNEDNTTVTEKFGQVDSALATMNGKMPKLKDFTVPSDAWVLSDGKYIAELDAGSDFVIDDNKMYLAKPVGDNDLVLTNSYGINVVSANATTQKITFKCFYTNSHPEENVNFKLGVIGG